MNIAASNIRAVDLAPNGSNAVIDLHSLLNISQELQTPLRQLSAPLNQLTGANNRLSEGERNRLYNIIGLHSNQLLDFIDQLLDTHLKGLPKLDQPADAPLPDPQKTTPNGRRCSTYDDELLDRLFHIMEENLEETEFNIHKMCSMLHISHMHLIRKVKQLTGKKPIDLLKSYRLKRAKSLLRQNNLTVAQVAYKVGYDMPNSFSRAFKKEFGISPSEYTF